MDYYSNQVWCRENNFGTSYDCRHLVSIDKYVNHDIEVLDKDWSNLISYEEIVNEIDIINKKEFLEKHPEYGEFDEEVERNFSKRHVPCLKEEVITWLFENVADRKDPECKKGWCIGSEQYRANNSLCGTSIFFHRRNDALNFIKTFSIYKKPVFYFNSFSDVRKELDFNTLKLVKKER